MASPIVQPHQPGCGEQTAQESTPWPRQGTPEERSGWDVEPGRWNYEQETVFSWKQNPQLAILPYQDLIIAESRQGGISHKTFVGSNFIRDIDINK